MGLLDFLFNRNDNVTQMPPNSAPNAAPDTASDSLEGSGMVIDDVFSIMGRGTVATGRARGELRIGDKVNIQCRDGQTVESTIAGIEAFRKTLDIANDGDNVGLLLQGVDRKQIQRGDVIHKL